jgi:hypothetical protein
MAFLKPIIALVSWQHVVREVITRQSEPLPLSPDGVVTSVLQHITNSSVMYIRFSNARRNILNLTLLLELRQCVKPRKQMRPIYVSLASYDSRDNDQTQSVLYRDVEGPSKLVQALLKLQRKLPSLPLRPEIQKAVIRRAHKDHTATRVSLATISSI